jgi:hypothetical protein
MIYYIRKEYNQILCVDGVSSFLYICVKLACTAVELVGVYTDGSLSSIARWPKFRPKSSKGAGGKITLARRICDRTLAEFYQKWQKGSEEYFLNKFFIKRH